MGGQAGGLEQAGETGADPFTSMNVWLSLQLLPLCLVLLLRKKIVQVRQQPQMQILENS